MPAARATYNLSSDERTLKHANGAQIRVLYAEDSTTSRIVTTALLRRMGLDVDAVEDGELALRQAEKYSYDVILLDIEMPIMDGVTAARSIRTLSRHCATPILALSAFLADSTENSIWRDAFDHALPKPANGNELHQAITRLLQSKPPALAEQPIQVNPAVLGSVASGLRAALPAGSWNRLTHMAAQEGLHYANAAVTACEAGDMATTLHCINALNSLAANFEAVDLAAFASSLQQEAFTFEQVCGLHARTTHWHQTCKAVL